MPDPSALGPHLYLGQKEVKALRRELLVDQLLTVTMCVERIPRTSGSHLRWWTVTLRGPLLYIQLTDCCQGFAPFGLLAYSGAKPLILRIKGIVPLMPDP
jgi:hypothetical protein